MRNCSHNTLFCRGRLAALGWMFAIALAVLVHRPVTAVGDTAPSALTPLKADVTMQMSFIRDEIQRLENDYNWLSEKVHRLKAFGRRIPNRVTESLRFKQEKIDTLKKLFRRYEKMIQPPAPPAVKPTMQDAKTSTEKGIKVKDLKTQVAPGEEKMTAALKKAGLADWLDIVQVTPSHIRVENRLPVLFQPAKAEIAKGYGSFLKKLAAFLKKTPARVTVDGYADSDPIRTKNYPSNFELGAARAGAVVRSLVGYGVDPSVFTIGSSGSHQKEKRSNAQWKKLQRHADISILFQNR